MSRPMASAPPFWKSAATTGRSCTGIRARRAGHLLRSRRRVAAANLALCFPDATPADRQQLLREHFASLGMTVIEGIKTNIPFHKRVLAFPAFAAGRYDTRIVDQILNPPAPEEAPKAAVAG